MEIPNLVGRRAHNIG